MNAVTRVLSDQRLAGIEAMLMDAKSPLGPEIRRVAKTEIDDRQYSLLVEWCGHLHISRGLLPNTVANYVGDMAEFMAWANTQTPAIAVGAATAAHGEAWQQDLFLRLGRAPQTRALKMSALRQFYRWMVHSGRMATNPMQSAPGPKTEKRQARRYTDAQLQALLSSCDRTKAIGRRDRAVLLLFLSTGARRDEVAALRLSQIAMQERVGVVRFFGKGAKERTVSFEGPVIQALREWYADRDQINAFDDSVFVGLTGRGKKGHGLRRSGLCSIITRAIKRAQLKLSAGMAVHTLRATYATALYDSGHDIRTIATLMGHDDINTTNRYIAISNKQMNSRLSSTITSKWANEESANDKTPLWARIKLQNRRG